MFTALTGYRGLLELTGRKILESTGLLETIQVIRNYRFIRITILLELAGHRFTRISRAYRFVRINSTYNFIKINRTYRFKSINRTHIFVRTTGRTDLRTSTINIGLPESTGRAGLLKLKEHTCLLGITGGKGLQTLTGHTVLLKFRDSDNNGGN